MVLCVLLTVREEAVLMVLCVLLFGMRQFSWSCVLLTVWEEAVLMVLCRMLGKRQFSQSCVGC